MKNSEKPTLIYLATFALASSVLMFEIVSLKFLSLKLLGSWGFLVISTAFLGIGAAGTYLYFKKEINLFKFSAFYAISLPLSIIIFALVPLSLPEAGQDVYRAGVSYEVVLGSLLYMIIFSLPFFLSGACVGYILSLGTISVGKVLFFDLSGAGLGSLSAVLLLGKLGGYGLVALAMILAFLASVLFSRKISLGYWLLFALFLFGLMIYPSVMVKINQFDIVAPKTMKSDFKILQDEFGGLAATYWSPIARVDVSREAESADSVLIAGLSEKYRDRKYTGRYIIVDFGASTKQLNLSKEGENPEFLGHFLLAIPYRLKKELDKVLIIGPGGGEEILIAKHFDPKNIDVVEINPAMVDILQGKNKKDPLTGIYSAFVSSDSRTKVNVYNEEARSFLSKNKSPEYDVVELNGVDLLSTLKSGGLVLSDNYLYTQEALGYYYDSLKEGGYVQIGYWQGQYSLRLFVTALSMLESKGRVEPYRSLVALTNGSWTNLIIKKGFFSDLETQEIKKIAKEDGFEILFDSDLRSELLERIGRIPLGFPVKIEYWVDKKDAYALAALDEKEFKEAGLLKNLPFDLTPTSDDKPFFYAIYKYNPRIPANQLSEWYAEASKQMTGERLIVIGAILAFLLILFPLFWRFKKITIPYEFLVFFGLAGFAFSLLEVVLIQKFSIFVGGPFYSMAVTLPALLIFYGLGAAFSSKINAHRFSIVASTIGLILSYGILGYLFFDDIIKQLFYLNHFGRIVWTILLVSPLGFLLGFPVPLVLEAIKEKAAKNIVPLLWGVNSSGNVMGALTFGVIAQTTGFNWLLLVCSLLYVLAMIFLLFKRSIIS